ncbi:MAG: SDR family NAD(P)-dependent oxidoreductase [Solirubrobacteraceae bacterium]
MEATRPEWSLAGAAIIVTGASSGVGAATARALGSAGARVALVGRHQDRLREEAAQVESAGGTAFTVTAELEDPQQAMQVVDRAVEEFGSLRGVVHTASRLVVGTLEETTVESAETDWRINVLAPIMMTQRAVPHLEPGSSVVFVGSTAGKVGFSGLLAYTATKGAVEAVTRALAVELAPRDIRVNAVVPGYVRTPMLTPSLDAIEGFEAEICEQTLQRRIGAPEELANAIVFMLSGLSTYVDGQSLVVDGGWTAH